MSRIRKNKAADQRTEPFWRIGLYIRLSREDDNKDESESVINQEKILRDFVDKYFEPGGYVIAGVFADAAVIIGLKIIRLKKFQKHGAF